MREISARLFPERQFYFRTNGIVRFISFSRNTQILASLAGTVIIGWMVLTSYNFIFRTEILAAKNVELSIAEKKYSEANRQFDKLKNDIQKSTSALEQRQIYLQQLLDASKTTAGDKTVPADNQQKPQEQNISHYSNQESIYSTHQQQMANLQFNITRIEQQQQALAEVMIDRISRKIAYVENTLTKSGIKSQRLIDLSENRPSLSLGMGGPFILYSENSDLDLSNSEPFAKLFAHYNRLIDLESAIQHIPVGKPTNKYYISSGFGIRKDPFRKTWARHNGIDLAGWWKNPIYASANGTVTKAGRNGAYGKFIEIDHGNGFLSRYGHLSRIKIKKGETVTLGQKIGLMGSTGRSTSPHLHYEIWFNGKPINPRKIFKASDNVLKIQRQEYDS